MLDNSFIPMEINAESRAYYACFQVSIVNRSEHRRAGTFQFSSLFVGPHCSERPMPKLKIENEVCSHPDSGAATGCVAAHNRNVTVPPNQRGGGCALISEPMTVAVSNAYGT